VNVHNSRFSLDQRVVTCVEYIAKFRTTILLLSLGSAITVCCSDQGHAFIHWKKSLTARSHSKHRRSMFSCDVYIYLNPMRWILKKQYIYIYTVYIYVYRVYIHSIYTVYIYCIYSIYIQYVYTVCIYVHYIYIHTVYIYCIYIHSIYILCIYIYCVYIHSIYIYIVFFNINRVGLRCI
jgi:hypothetical protein